MESHFRARGRRGPEPRGSAVIYSRSPASGWHNGPGGPQARDRAWPSTLAAGRDAATRWRQSSPSPPLPSPQDSPGTAHHSAPTGRTDLLLPRVQRPRPGGDPERAASGPLPPPDSIRPASSSATQITRRRAAQGSVDVGRQEEVFVKILLDTSFADDCFSQSLLQCPPQSQFSCLHPCGVEMEFTLWSKQLMALNRLQMSSPVTSFGPW